MVTEGSIMACQVLIEYVNSVFHKPDTDIVTAKASKQGSQVFTHEQDLLMWQCILDTILKIDSSLTYIDKQNSQQTQSKLYTQNSLKDILSLDISSLVDFNEILSKVNKNQEVMMSTDVNKLNKLNRKAANVLTFNEDMPLKVWCFSEPALARQKQMQTVEVNHPKLVRIQEKVIMPYQ